MSARCNVGNGSVKVSGSGAARSRVAVFLGAGFSALAGIPLASQLFHDCPVADLPLRQDLVERVLYNWEEWRARQGGTAEEYLSTLEASKGQAWREALRYVALVVTLSTPGVVVRGRRPLIDGHTLNLANKVAVHELFWGAVLEQTSDLAVVTTNYDIVAERGLRLAPRRRLGLPGFNYGVVGERLAGGKGPGFFRNPWPSAAGSVPVFKLHGSVSWAYGRGGLEKYHDCRPAIRGDAAIIAPVREKEIPRAFGGVWSGAAEALCTAGKWLVVGYSFPEYDLAVNELLRNCYRAGTTVHVANPDRDAVSRLGKLIPMPNVVRHGGLPDALGEIRAMLGK